MTYWEQRALAKQRLIDAMDNKTVYQLAQAYDRAVEQLDADILKIIGTYTRKTGLTPQEARRFLNEGIAYTERLLIEARIAAVTDEVKRRQLYTLLNTDAYRARITRIQAIQLDARATMYSVADVELPLLRQHLQDAAHLTYSQTMYDVQHVSGFGFKADGVTNIDALLKNRWSGNNFSNRIWNDANVVADRMKTALFEQSTIGKLSDKTLTDIRGMVDLDKWRKQLTSKFKTEAQYAKYAANRLARTETAYICNDINAEVYAECGVEKYVFIATLDSRTSNVCQDHDNQEYLLSEKEVGVNFPPLHPHCRSTTGAVIDGVARDKMERRARKPDGSTELIPASMSYSKWKAWQDAGAPDLKTWLQ